MKRKKVWIPVIIVVAIIAVGVIAVGSAFAGFNNPAGDHQKILKSGSTPAKAAIVVYQPTLTGASNKMAEQIAKGLNDSGYDVLVNNPGSYLPKDLSGYSVVVFGSPVYAGKLSPVLLNYIKTVQLNPSQKVILFDTGSMNESPELDSAAALLDGAQITKVKFDVSGQGIENKAYDLGKNA